MISPTLSLLEEIIRAGATDGERSLQKLRDPEIEREISWFLYVPVRFNDALDLRKQTRYEDRKPYEVWTQGANFSFKPGDVLYDCQAAYEEWGVALKKISRAVQVRSATDVSPAKISSPRFAGLVEFDLLEPNSARTELVVTSRLTYSQDEFVRYLISGKPEPFLAQE